jgi:hypothetical protein
MEQNVHAKVTPVTAGNDLQNIWMVLHGRMEHLQQQQIFQPKCAHVYQSALKEAGTRTWLVHRSKDNINSSIRRNVTVTALSVLTWVPGMISVACIWWYSLQAVGSYTDTPQSWKEKKRRSSFGAATTAYGFKLKTHRLFVMWPPGLWCHVVCTWSLQFCLPPSWGQNFYQTTKQQETTIWTVINIET